MTYQRAPIARASCRRAIACGTALVAIALASADLDAASPIRYRLSFPSPEHHWMQVEAVFTDLPAGPVQLRMSRSSPGRYSLHDFAKNVYDVRVSGPDGLEILTTRPDPHGWTVPAHRGTLSVQYKVFGDRLDGTYLAIDRTHAHINMPPALMWARGHDDRPASIVLEPPRGQRWTAATQLFQGSTPLEFTAPNLQYLMDSPIEFGPLTIRQFTWSGRTFRLAVHHRGTDAEVDAVLGDVEKIVRESAEIFGEYPDFEPGHYTFLVDLLPYAIADAMEHRNSTVITAPRALSSGRSTFLDAAAHEFFHVWNVERIRPAALEPFDFERPNMAGELWFAEGFTQYFGALVLSRAGLMDRAGVYATLEDLIVSVTSNPAHRVRAADEMSRMAVFTDGGHTGDPTNWSNTYISYYPFGGALALALDLALRDRSDGRVTLDDYMRAMWRAHGKPGGARPGYVDRPFTADDAEARLAEVSGDAAFAREFFGRHVRGRDLPDFARLLLRAGLVLRRAAPNTAWWGDVSLEDTRQGARIVALTAFDSPAYVAGLDADDEIRAIDGQAVKAAGDVRAAIRRRRPGDRIVVTFTDRAGGDHTAHVTLQEDPQLELVPLEAAGGTLTSAQRTFRERWLN